MVLKEWRVEIGEKQQLMSGRKQEWNRRKFLMEELKVREAIPLTMRQSYRTFQSLTSILLSADICEDFW